MKKILFIIPVLALLSIVFFINNKLKQTSKDISDLETFSINLNDLDDLKITSGGIYTLEGILNGSITVNTNDNVKLILNNITINSSNSSCIYIEKANDFYIELIGNNTLNDTNNYKNVDINSTIYSKSNMTIEGNGTININANYKNAISSKDTLNILSGTYNIKSIEDGIVGKDEVNITDGVFNIESNVDGIKSTNEIDTDKGNINIINGNFNITSINDGIQAVNNLVIKNGIFNIKTNDGSSLKSTNSNWNFTDTISAKGLKSNNIVIENGSFVINSSDDSIHSNNSVVINNANIEILSGDDGIHADKEVTINSGTVNIKESYEGIESVNITINDGNINVNSNDDGFNGSGGNDSSGLGRPGNGITSSRNSLITINNGILYINSTGDGIDSNGSIILNGGNVIVEGSTNNGNGAIDYDSKFTSNGGTLIAIGASGMAQNISDGSSYGILINLKEINSKNTKISLNDIEYTSTKEFNSILIVSNNFELNKNYVLYLNEIESQNIELNNKITNIGSSNGFNAFGNRQMFR